MMAKPNLNQFMSLVKQTVRILDRMEAQEAALNESDPKVMAAYWNRTVCFRGKQRAIRGWVTTLSNYRTSTRTGRREP